MVKWKIDYYSTPSGKEPVQKFIEKLSYTPQSRVYNTLELLAELGIRLGLPHAKKITKTPLWELRVLGEKSLRFFYVARVGRIFLLLHGFSKKKQKTPRREIKTALNRLRDHKNRA